MMLSCQTENVSQLSFSSSIIGLMKISKTERELFSRMGKRGGLRRAQRLTAEHRREIARLGGQAKAAKQKAKTTQ